MADPIKNDSEKSFLSKITKGLQTVGLVSKKIDRTDVRDTLSFHIRSRINPSKIEECEGAIDAVDRTKHPVSGILQSITTPNKLSVTLSDGDKKILDDLVADITKNSKDTKAKIKIDTFREEMKAANEVIAADKTRNRFSAENFRDLLFGLRGEVLAELTKAEKNNENPNPKNKQHELEVEAVKEAFKKPDFQSQLTDPTKRKELQDEMVKTLEAKQKEELKTFNDKVDQELKKLMEMKLAEDARLAFLGIINKSKANKNVLADLRAKKDFPSGEGSGFTASDEGTRLFGIKPDEIKTFETASGKTVTPGQDGSFSIKSGFFSSITKADLLACAMGVKAALMSRVPPIAPENQTITMNAEHSDESKALKLGKKAFEAALEAGFDLNNITVNVNGKKMSAAELGVNTHLKGMTSTFSDVDGNREFKEAVKSMRDKGKESSKKDTVIGAANNTETPNKDAAHIRGNIPNPNTVVSITGSPNTENPENTGTVISSVKQ